MFQIAKICRQKFLNTTKFQFSTASKQNAQHSCKVLVVGGGSGGCSTAAKLSRILQKHELIILEPADRHYYQPLFTLIGGTMCDLSQASRPMGKVLPKNSTWLKDSVGEFHPRLNSVTTIKGDQIKYDLMLIGVGLDCDYEQIPGLIDGLTMKSSGVCSNYSVKYVQRTCETLKNFQSGNAIFTYPDSPAKCPGAPQKICYITEDYLRKAGKRDKANVIYNTSLSVIFGVKHYADALWKVVKERDIKVNLHTNLIEIKPEKKEAIFQDLNKPENKTVFEYSMLHVTPPQHTPHALNQCKDLVNDCGFVDVCPKTLQNKRFPNVFAIGDCSSSPNSKTAAAAASQCAVIYQHMKALLEGKTQPNDCQYDGYASCPLVTGLNKCILAEFDYSLTPLETFPFRQDTERRTMFYLKRYFLPFLYWNLMVTGRWNGPKMYRNLMHLKLF